MGSSPSIHDVNAESAEHIAVVIQISILLNQSLFVVHLEDVLWTYTFLSRWVCMRADPDGKLWPRHGESNPDSQRA